MRKKNVLVVTLVLVALLGSSMFTGVAVNVETSNFSESLEVVKDVFNGEEWVDNIDAEIDETVQFRITLTYHNVTDPGHTHYAVNINVTDTLPEGLEYVVGSAQPEEPDVSDGVLVWDFGGTRLYDGESIVITFNATVVDFGTHVNNVYAEAYEFCTGMTIFGEDISIVNVPLPRVGIDVEKLVWDGICDWVDEIWADHCSIVRFKITVENTGNVSLTDVYVNDTLSDSLEYMDNATVNGVPCEPTVSPDGKILTWYFDVLPVDETIEIEFDVHVIGMPCSEDVNWVEATGMGPCGLMALDRDSAIVHVNGMCMEKEVWDDELQAWMEETTQEVGKTVRFRIRIMYFGDYRLYNIKVRDELPLCLEYADNAVPEEPEVSDDGKTLWWNLSKEEYKLHNGESLIIEFDALVSSSNCQPCYNWANVTANECSGKILYWDDPATVIPECGVHADAGGPYSGAVDDDVEITGSASGGVPPYSYYWDLDDDGEYDDATGATVTWLWDEPGDYIIWLKVIDDEDNTAIDYASVTITKENHPPNTPSKPSGPSSGKPGVSYTYTSSAADPDDDQIYYLFDWDDGTDSGWKGPYNSGETVSVSHVWSSEGTYQVRVKAKDAHGEESSWSDPLSITMPRSRFIQEHLFLLKLLNRLSQTFPWIKHFFKL